MDPDPNVDPVAGPSSDADAAADASAGEDAADDASDAAQLRAHAAALADGIDVALPGWVVRCVERVMVAWRNEVPEAVLAEAKAAGEAARASIVPRVRALLLADIDDQRTSPLAIVREAVRFPTEVLERAAVPAVVRDAHAESQFPHDAYDLTPASFAELDPALHEPGLHWGAAKAHVHLRRHRGS